MVNDIDGMEKVLNCNYINEFLVENFAILFCNVNLTFLTYILWYIKCNKNFIEIALILSSFIRTLNIFVFIIKFAQKQLPSQHHEFLYQKYKLIYSLNIK